MTPDKNVTSKGDAKVDEDVELEQHRRSRLWLGYSVDDLLKNQQESAPQHAEASQSQPPAGESGPQTGSRKGASQRQSGPTDEDTKSKEYDQVPQDFENLDEIAAPSPIEQPQEEREQGYVEDRGRSSGTGEKNGAPVDFGNLDEIAAPPPANIERGTKQNGHLEDGVTTFPTSEKKPAKLGSSVNISDLATEIYTISYLIFFSILGTLARLGLQALTFYPAAPVQTGLLWANVGGSLIIGFLSEDRKLFRDEWGTGRDEKHETQNQRSASANNRHLEVKKTLPLYIGLATGFCGSFTSFSSFMRDSFFALSNALPVPIQHPSSTRISPTIDVPRNGGYSFLALLAVIITTVGLSLQALQFGAHVALFVEPHIPSLRFLFVRRIIDRSVVFLAFGCWLAAILMAIWPPDRPAGPVGNATWAQETWRSQALLALVFAPLGCLLRFYASLHLNGRIKAFPLGTFAVNVIGSALDAVFIDLQRAPVGGLVGCQVLQGMADGFCGCLTTVSTWVVELEALRLRHAYIYGLMSVGVGLSFFIVIAGSLQWTQGFTHPLCMT